MLNKTYREEIKGFLSSDECRELIDMSELVGYEEALIQTRAGQEMNKDVRDNYRVIIDDVDMASDLWGRMKDICPSEYIDPDGIKWESIGLNERFRFYRYEYGQQFKRHVDGAFKRSDGEISFVTVLLYLNDDFNGGETQFFHPHDVIIPEQGTLFLFRHRQLHQGNQVTTGRKYVLRTDIMYKKK